MKLKLEKYYLLALVFIPLIAVFAFIEKALVPKYTVYYFIDSYIPFIPAFAVFYFVWFIYMFVATAYFMFNSKRDFIKLTLFMASGMAICYVLYTIFPNQQALRPSDTGGGVFGAIVGWLYSIDSPTNVCPSIHVINALGVHFCICDSEMLGGNKTVRVLSLITACLIIASTMLIKQHSVVDVVFGIALALVIKAVLEYAERRKNR